MAAPEEGGTEAPPRPPPPAEGEPPGATCGEAILGAAAAAEESGGLPAPAELRAVPKESTRSSAALEGGTVLYAQAESAGPSAEEQPPSPSRHAATPLAPAELQRVIERVSRARELREASPPLRDGGPEPPAPPAAVVQNAALRLRSVAQRVALQRGAALAPARLLPRQVGLRGTASLWGGKEVLESAAMRRYGLRREVGESPSVEASGNRGEVAPRNVVSGDGPGLDCVVLRHLQF